MLSRPFRSLFAFDPTAPRLLISIYIINNRIYVHFFKQCVFTHSRALMHTLRLARDVALKRWRKTIGAANVAAGSPKQAELKAALMDVLGRLLDPQL